MPKLTSKKHFFAGNVNKELTLQWFTLNLARGTAILEFLQNG